MDRVAEQKRSKNMAAVKNRGNKSTELQLIKLFRANRITGWRRHQSVFGNPDFIFKDDKVAIFVDGCFWHGCKKHKTIPKQNRSFWIKKIEQNKKRDKLVTVKLRRDGWKVLRIWEHELKPSKQEKALNKIATFLK